MLIDCPECTCKVSDQAVACPKCGCPTTERTEHPRQPELPKSRIIIVCALILVVLGGAYYMLPGAQPSTPSATNSEKPTPGKTAPQPVKKEITDADRIVGTWKGEMDSIEFFANGDYKAYALLATQTGKWKMSDGKRLNIIMDSSLLPDAEWRYAITGNTLTLTNMRGNFKMEFRKK